MISNTRLRMNNLKIEMDKVFEKDMKKFCKLRQEWELLNNETESDEEGFDEKDKDTSWLDDEQFYAERVRNISDSTRWSKPIVVHRDEYENVTQLMEILQKNRTTFKK
jgi:hypothetical protein